MELAKECLYTIRNSESLGGTGDAIVHWHIKHKNMAAVRAFEWARAAGHTMPVVIADADDHGSIIAWGSVVSIRSAANGTSVDISNIQRVQDHSRQELRLLTTGKPLGRNFRRACVLVQTPDFIVGAEAMPTPVAAATVPDGIIEFPFQSAAVDQAPIRAWAAAHPHGYVLTFLAETRALLLSFECSHLGKLHPKLAANTPQTPRRLCSDSAEMLQLWAQAQAVEVGHCRQCERASRLAAGVIGTEAKGTGSPTNNLREAVEEAEVQRVQRRTDIGAATKEALVLARRGHGLYRENVEINEIACRVTGVLDRRHLRASHIKPWYCCDDSEKLDGYNGLLLAPHIDHLFDRGHISFADSGELLVSPHLNPAVLGAWGLKAGRKVGAFKPEQRMYLAYHRQHVFDHEAGGRRGKRQGQS
jgi:hypothetical protein